MTEPQVSNCPRCGGAMDINPDGLECPKCCSILGNKATNSLFDSLPPESRDRILFNYALISTRLIAKLTDEPFDEIARRLMPGAIAFTNIQPLTEDNADKPG